MGFSGGGSNILKPHTHDSNILQDGGNLDFKNITQGDMSAGSVTYSDGSHLQELAIGSPAAQLVVNAGATAPEWATGHVQGQWQLIETYKAPGAASTYTFTFDALTPDDISALVLVYSMGSTAALNLELVVEGITNNETNYIRIDGSAVTALQHPNGSPEQQICSNTLLLTADSSANGVVYIMNSAATGSAQRPCITFTVSSQNTAAYEGGAGCCFDTKSSFTTITVQTSTSTWQQNSIFSLYKILR